MSKERKPQSIILYVELEDNVGQILAKKQVVVPISLNGKTLDESAIQTFFNKFVESGLPTKLEL